MSNHKRRIFILEDIPADADLMVEELRQSGMPFDYSVHASRHDFIQKVQAFQPNVIIADYSLPGFNALHAFKLLELEGFDIPFILISGELSEDIVIEFLKQGIADYVMKDNIKRLPHAVDAVLKKKEIQEEREKLLRESKVLNSILEATSDFVGIAGTDFISRYINPAGRKMLGITSENYAQEIKIKDLHPGWAMRYIADEGIPYAVKNGIWRGETALLSTDKKEIPVSQVIIAHKNEKGVVEYYSTIAREIKAASSGSE